MARAGGLAGLRGGGRRRAGGDADTPTPTVAVSLIAFADVCARRPFAPLQLSFEKVCQYTDDGLHFTKDVVSLFKKRHAIEAEYAKQLSESRSPSPSPHHCHTARTPQAGGALSGGGGRGLCPLSNAIGDAQAALAAGMRE